MICSEAASAAERAGPNRVRRIRPKFDGTTSEVYEETCPTHPSTSRRIRQPAVVDRYEEPIAHDGLLDLALREWNIDRPMLPFRMTSGMNVRGNTDLAARRCDGGARRTTRVREPFPTRTSNNSDILQSERSEYASPLGIDAHTWQLNQRSLGDRDRIPTAISSPYLRMTTRC